METLRVAFLEKGFELPEFIVHLILNGTSRKHIYKRLWAVAVFMGHLGNGKQTLSFPIELREAIRERFPDTEAGAYDYQYDVDNASVYHVSIEELATIKYPAVKN